MKIKHILSIALTTAMMTGFACQDQAGRPGTFFMEDDGQWEKVSTAHRLSQFPKIHPDGRIWFRYEAPQTAESVTLHIRNIEYGMQKDTAGLWNVVIPGTGPGFQIYSFNVDGASIIDPGCTPFYVNGYTSVIEYPAPDDEFYSIKNVPHGDVREHWFYSQVAGSFRRMYVYTPPGYEKNTGTRYPVLYLQHGGGELENEWIHSARANFILDNLIAGGRARPMIIVMNLGFVTRPGQEGQAPVPGYQPGFAAAFEEMLISEVIPDVDAYFRTIADSRHRAMAGLSRGGGQTFYIGLENTGTFASMGVFSSGLFRGTRGPGGENLKFNAEEQIPGLLTKAASFNKALDLFYISCGEQDERIEPTKKAVATFRENGLEVEFASFPGDHEWQVWRKSLHDFARRLFR